MPSKKVAALLLSTSLPFFFGATSTRAAEMTQVPTETPSPDDERARTIGEMVKSLFGGVGESQSENQNGDDFTPAGMESEAALISPHEYLTDEEIKSARPWRAPDYANQVGALGWSETVFDTPTAMAERVSFWRDIYTKYTTDQGVIHDSVHIGVVYTAIDFGDIMRDRSKNIYQKARLREKLVKEKKAEIAQRLSRLHGRTSADGLSGEDLRLWKLFEKISYPDRFKDASSKNRLRFQLGQRDKFITGIFHSGRYLAQMEKIFKDEGLPIELTRLPFVESSFNLRARSRVGASGIWQFMPRTARPYMKVNRETDERNDPLKSTRASARMLRTNYQMLQAWPLAITGYNHGPSGVKRITEKVGTKDLAKIIGTYSSRTFGFASENFYACFLAALDAEKNAKKYFGDVKWGPEADAVEIKLAKTIPYKTLLQFFNNDKAGAELANPHLTQRIRKGRSPVPVRSYIRVPPARAEIAREWLKGKMPPAKLAKLLSDTPIITINPSAPQPAVAGPGVEPTQSSSGERKP